VNADPSESLDAAARVRASFARQAMMATMGVELVSVEPGVVVLELPFSGALAQQHGFLHAGAISAVADSACGFAALSLMSADAAVMSAEFKLNLLAPAAGERFRATGRVIRAGRTLSVCTAEVEALVGDERRLVALMQGTMMAVRGREGVRD
jgi:uncharacterized protein (TIGR00369 family)